MEDSSKYEYIGLIANIMMVVSIMFSLHHLIKEKTLVSYPVHVLVINFIANCMWIYYGCGIGATMTAVMGLMFGVYYAFLLFAKVYLQW